MPDHRVAKPDDEKPKRSPSAADLMKCVADWRRAQDAPAGCPACGAQALSIVDKSARPYREWYTFACTACGLDRTLEIPLAGPPPGA